MFWLSILKHIIPYIWDVFIKKYDEEGNPVLWSKTMIFGMLITIIVVYYNLYSFIHTNTEKEHTLNIKNMEQIKILVKKNIELDEELKTIVVERDNLRHESLIVKSQLSEARLDVLQLTDKLDKCNNIKATVIHQQNHDSSSNKSSKSEKTNKVNNVEAILKGMYK